MTRTVLITGATGFAGSFLVEHYSREGWTVHGSSHGPAVDLSWLPAGATLHEIDLRDAQATRNLVAEVRPDVVAHLAAQSSVRESIRDSLGTFRDNVGMQMNVLDAVGAEAPGTTVLVVGSGDEYGNVEPAENPVAEGQELRPVNPYAVSKVAQDLMGYQYFISHGIRVVRVRPFVQIGPRRSDQFVAGSFARQVAEIQAGLAAPVIEVGNIDLKRDITDVRDVVRGYALLVERGHPGEVYNLGSGTGTTIRQLLGAIMRAAGIEAEIRQESQLRRTGEPEVLIGDISKLEEATGWAPHISLQQSAADTLAYWRGQVAARAGSAS